MLVYRRALSDIQDSIAGEAFPFFLAPFVVSWNIDPRFFRRHNRTEILSRETICTIYVILSIWTIKISSLPMDSLRHNILNLRRPCALNRRPFPAIYIPCSIASKSFQEELTQAIKSLSVAVYSIANFTAGSFVFCPLIRQNNEGLLVIALSMTSSTTWGFQRGEEDRKKGEKLTSANSKT